MKNKTIIQGKESTIELIPAFDDNYIFVGKENGSSSAFVVDPGDAYPVTNFLKKENLVLNTILLTHEHDDHIGGVSKLLEHFPACQVIGSPEMRKFLPDSGERFIENRATDFDFGKLHFKVLFSPGHTKDHYAYYLPKDEFLFCGDILFGMGCGRVISGTHTDHYATLSKIGQLPDSVRIFCAHEYSFKNFEFFLKQNQYFPEAVKVNENNFQETAAYIKNTLESQMSIDHATVPLNLGFEKKYNPFLNCRTFKEFKTLRDLRDRF